MISRLCKWRINFVKKMQKDWKNKVCQKVLKKKKKRKNRKYVGGCKIK
jgi:hypothetical protein